MAEARRRHARSRRAFSAEVLSHHALPFDPLFFPRVFSFFLRSGKF